MNGEIVTRGPIVPDKYAERRKAMRGLGDVIAKATSMVGITPCGGCKKRQAALNAMFPFGSDEKAPANELVTNTNAK